ncbi:MAG: hypothetical protein V4530_04655 [Pseudomonadota bacterium]
MQERTNVVNDPQAGGVGSDRNEELAQAQSVGGDGRKSAMLQQAAQEAGLTTNTTVQPDEESLEEADRSV